jgi:hypothetical protein
MNFPDIVKAGFAGCFVKSFVQDPASLPATTTAAATTTTTTTTTAAGAVTTTTTAAAAGGTTTTTTKAVVTITTPTTTTVTLPIGGEKNFLTKLFNQKARSLCLKGRCLP